MAFTYICTEFWNTIHLVLENCYLKEVKISEATHNQSRIPFHFGFKYGHLGIRSIQPLLIVRREVAVGKFPVGAVSNLQ